MENIWLDKLGGRNLGIAVLVVTVTALSPVQSRLHKIIFFRYLMFVFIKFSVKVRQLFFV